MEAVDDEPGPARRLPAAEVDDAADDARRQQHQRDGSRATRGVPPDARRAGERQHHGEVSAGQPARRTTSPPGRTSRLGSSRAVNQAGATSPRTIAAVAATLASTQEPAATLAVRQTSTAESPVAGSTMWWRAPSWVAQRRTDVLEVASPPSRTVTVSPAGAPAGA